LAAPVLVGIGHVGFLGRSGVLSWQYLATVALKLVVVGSRYMTHVVWGLILSRRG
jgi:hypothetical protein